MHDMHNYMHMSCVKVHMQGLYKCLVVDNFVVVAPKINLLSLRLCERIKTSRCNTS